MSFVLDASVALLWLIPDSQPAGVPYARSVLELLKEGQALVPSLFFLEVANVISKLEGKGRLTEADTQRYLALLGRLNIAIDSATAKQALGDTLNLARRHRLSAYDATYLELALREGLPLTTLDTDLAEAAKAAGAQTLIIQDPA